MSLNKDDFIISLSHIDTHGGDPMDQQKTTKLNDYNNQCLFIYHYLLQHCPEMAQCDHNKKHYITTLPTNLHENVIIGGLGTVELEEVCTDSD